jgi:predicted RNA-binding Zn-ribbon protein involved in translation (DUF1610 family)
MTRKPDPSRLLLSALLIALPLGAQSLLQKNSHDPWGIGMIAVFLVLAAWAVGSAIRRSGKAAQAEAVSGAQAGKSVSVHGDSETFRRAWASLRLRRMVQIAAWAPVVFVLVFCAYYRLSGVSEQELLARVGFGDNQFLLVFLGWTVVLAASSIWTFLFRCPSCGKPFFRSETTGRGFAMASRCLNCGIRKYQMPESK